MKTSKTRKKPRLNDPTKLLAIVMERLNAKCDADLCRALEVSPPIISKIRSRRNPVGAALVIRIHEETGMSIREINTLLDPAYTPRRSSGPATPVSN